MIAHRNPIITSAMSRGWTLQIFVAGGGFEPPTFGSLSRKR
jgi:hypothetical protein